MRIRGDVNFSSFSAIILEQIEIGKTGLIQGNDFAVHDGFFRKLAERFDDERILTIERVVPTR